MAFFRRFRAAALSLALLLSGCAGQGGGSRVPPAAGEAAPVSVPAFRRSLAALDFSALSFTPWDGVGVAAALPTRAPAPYTVMIYLNGSDLESENGAATADLAEMLKALPGGAAVNVVLFTGGANRWRNNIVPASQCALWRLEDGRLAPLGGVGQRNMGDAGTLAGFLDFAMTAFPAERYGLILWDHGGGSIAGYGHDENFQNSCLTLLEMNYAFSRSPLAQTKLEFLGFDACLMATAEMAVVAADYARYLIASEDLEPGDGWDYRFLAALARNPDMDGAALGRVIADTYMDFYRAAPPGGLTLSVTDLSRAGEVMGAMGALMAACTDGLDAAPSIAAPLAAARGRTKTFGGGTPRDSACDMVDAGDMADRLAALRPAEAAALRAVLHRAVVYQRHNATVALSGLSCYYVYGGMEEADATLAVYRALQMSPEYTAYLGKFSAALAPANPAQPVSRSTGGAVLYPRINGHWAELYEVGTSRAGAEYAAPVLLNGRQADLIVLVSDEYPDGRVLGVRQEEGYVIQKGVDPVGPGDVLALCRRAGGAWPVTEQFTVTGPLAVTWEVR